MPSVNEAANAYSQANSDLAGSRLLSRNANIVFTRYIKQVLPLDGFVFWIKTISDTVQGSLHYTSDKRQLEDETISINRVRLTTGHEIQLFNEIEPNVLWIGDFQGIKFAFTRNIGLYQASGVYHYDGDALYPAMYSQLVESGAQLSDATLIVSNSLPAWLTLQTYNPVWLAPYNPDITLYPSFAVPDNLRPPYGTVHVMPERTRALQSTPLLGPRYQHYQLMSDTVRVTLYGAANSAAMDFVDLVNSYIRDTNVLGMMSMPAMRDEKRTQAELGILAMKKTIEFEVSYYQTQINDIARQLIEHVRVTYFPQEFASNAAVSA